MDERAYFGTRDILTIARFVTRRFRDMQHYEDLFQDACLGVLEYMESSSFSRDSVVEKARRAVDNAFRRYRRRDLKICSLGQWEDLLRYEESHLRRMIVSEAMNTLTKNRREIVWRYFWLGQEAGEIARDTCRKPRTITKKRADALAALSGPLSGVLHLKV